jgi:CheY-like chemotaxis protein
MGARILVVDDSKNIQKVIEIIFEQRDYEVIECLTLEKLYEESKGSIDLVLLDFTIDPDQDGYELAKKIKDEHSCKVTLLFGTFDSIDEDKIKEHGIDNFVFKPFDSEKLLSVTDSVLEGDSPAAIKADTKVESAPSKINESSETPDENFPDEIVESAENEKSSDTSTNTRVVKSFEAVGEEQAWGVTIPSIIGDNASSKTNQDELSENNQRIPTIIEKEITKTVIGGIDSIGTRDESEEEEKTVYPKDEDLEYPQVIKSPGESFIPEATSSKLVPSDSLLIDIPDEEESFKMEQTAIVNTSKLKADEENLQKLKKEIFDELDEDLWKKTNTQIFVGELGKNTIENSPSNNNDLKREILAELKSELLGSIKQEIFDELRNTIFDLLKEELVPHFEEHIKEYCKDAVESGVWKILPDLAEKVITRDLQEIKDSIDFN